MPDVRQPVPSRPNEVVASALMVACYVLTAHVGLRLAVVADQVTTVWPPSGIAIAALLLWGPRLAPAVWLGAFIANALVNAPLWTAAIIAAGNAAEALIAWFLLSRLRRFDRRLRRVNDVVAFILLAACAAPMVSATAGVATLCAGGLQSWDRFGVLWRAWWLGDAVGTLIVAPVLLTVGHLDLRTWRQRASAGGLAAAAMLVTLVIFRAAPGPPHHPLEYLIFPFVIAAAMRGGLPLTSVVVLTASSLAIASTAAGRGPFAGTGLHDSLVLLQLYMGVIAGTGLLLAAAIGERETSDRRRTAAARVGEVLASSDDLETAAPALLRAVCTALRWQVGALWVVDEPHGRLRCLSAWSESDLEAGAFLARTRELTVTPGVGLPGRVWASRQPAWIVDVVADRNFPRADAAHEAGLHGAFGFPILLEGELLGVIEFFHHTHIPPDPELLQTMTAVGHQVGQFVARKREEGAARQAEREREHLLVREAAARSEAEAANRAKDEFLATLSHELRTPLNAIVGWTRMLAEGVLDEASTRHALDVIERNAHLQSQLVADILDVSRIVTGKVRLDLRPVELGTIVGAALDAVRPTAASRQVQLRAKPGPSPRVVHGDPERLQQVVWNLLANAVKFTEPGGWVQVEIEEGARGRVLIRVSDNGAGIDAAFLPHVFERFRQADGSLSRQHGGLGLGLAIVRHLVELHGGSVHARSEGAGQGATFTVELPALLAIETLPTPSRSTPLSEAGLAAALLNGVRVLLVDDHADGRELVAAMLRAAGAHVETAGSVAEAVDALDASTPDVLLSDIGMPEADGYALIREVRRRDAARGARLPAAALTAYASARDRADALEAGFDHHLPKPVGQDALVAAVLALVSGATSQRR